MQNFRLNGWLANIFRIGIFTTDGQLWHNSRQLIRPQFVKDRLSDIDIFEQHTQILISKIAQSEEIDTLDMMFRYTLDAATHFLLGQSVGSLDEPQTVFADAFYNAQRVQGYVPKLGYVGLPIFLKVVTDTK
jgi:cytochrome P450